MTERDLKDLLDTEAARINSPSFISDDPVQFPRRFTDVRDIELAALLTSGIAWGNRKMICRDCDRLLALMDNQPYNYLDGPVAMRTSLTVRISTARFLHSISSTT